MRQLTLAGLAVLGLGLQATQAQEARRDIGVLTCSMLESDDAQTGSDVALPRLKRDIACTYRPRDLGPEETYVGSLQIATDQQLASTQIWIVIESAVLVKSAGLLGQVYAIDPAAPLDRSPALIGESNSAVILQPMADETPVAGDSRKRMIGPLIVIVALQLKSAAS